MRRIHGLAAMAALLLTAVQVSAVTFTFDFEGGNDQGFGTGFGDDASRTLPIVNIGGSNRMEAENTPAFQETGRQSQGADAFLAAMNAAMLNPSGYLIKYDWYVDTSLPGNNGTFLQLGTYINSGGGSYTQDFPGAGKDVELSGAQLASGQVFSGTVSETVTQKYGALDPGFLGQTFMRFGLIVQGDGTPTTGGPAGLKVYFDNITITPIPEPASLALLALVVPALLSWRRKSHN